MNAETHMYVGAAASLAILQPTSIDNTLICIAGGMLGGWLCDIDVNSKSDIKDYFAGIETFIAIGVMGIADYIFGFGIIDCILKNRSIFNAVGAISFLLLGVLGAKHPKLNPHRTFMHSLSALTLFATSLILAFPPIVFPFAIGMLLHILLDLTNNQGVQLLYPLKFKPCFKLYESNGMCDLVIRYLALSATIILAVWRISGGILDSSNLAMIVTEAHHKVSLFGLSSFQLYIIVINIFTFLFCCYDYQRFNHNCRVGKGTTIFDTINTYICEILTIAGGALGMLLALILCNLDTKKSWSGVKKIDVVRQGDNGNAWWFVSVVSTLLAWIGVYIAVTNPLGLDYNELTYFNTIEHLPLICSFLLLNIITFYAFWKDRIHKRRRFDHVQFCLLLLCAIGGSLGGLIAMAITHKKVDSIHFAKGLPALLITNVILIIILILTGIA